MSQRKSDLGIPLPYTWLNPSTRPSSLDDTRKITFDPHTAEVTLAIRDALHPVVGTKADHFAGLREGALKRILKSCFNDMKADRDAELRGQAGERQPASDWTDELKLDAEGRVRPILSNLVLYLRHHPKWKGVLAYDVFSARVIIRSCLPWGDEAPGTHWEDRHETLTRIWFQQEDLDAGLGDIGRAVQTVARDNPVHPVREYLDSLVWDGTPRLDTWLVTHLHAEDSAYIRAVGLRFLVSAVARVYDPGCQVDHMLVLEGPQGRKKSQSLRTLAVRDEWFSDRLSHIASKDAAIEVVAGVWLFEIAEMDALVRAASSTAKGFLTRPRDRFRPPYGKHTANLPRQCVFAGTINPPVGGYLKDPTGGRRFWPVVCNGTINCNRIERDRDQLWAEAAHRFRAGQKWWLETPELEALATAEQAARYMADIWTQPIKRWLGEHRADVSVAEVLEGALGIKPPDQSHSAQIRVVNILTAMGFARYLGREGTRRQKRYRRNEA